MITFDDIRRAQGENDEAETEVLRAFVAVEQARHQLQSQSIAELVRTVKLNADEESTRAAARELHARGVSIVGIIPTTPRPKARPVLLDSIPSGY